MIYIKLKENELNIQSTKSDIKLFMIKNNFNIEDINNFMSLEYNISNKDLENCDIIKKYAFFYTPIVSPNFLMIQKYTFIRHIKGNVYLLSNIEVYE